MKNNPQSVKEVEEAIKTWSEALSNKDLEAMHKDYADEYRMFDVSVTVDSVQGLKDLWKQCFDFFDKPKAEYKDMKIQATDNMAVAHFKSRISGMTAPVPEEMANSWIRGTVCFQKENGVWKCIHEHISFPVNCETNQIAFDK
ncbi:MAG: nuclear transport factor 2 family protein [Rickettsiales bacterium]|nr:nuclear transport factor 2 family protein [Pseudomonadota bacterium]MDA0966987.1 nuclear transport factor 2 family protein [Pseudomonadota bacterium]MDG4543907.1 nuclear transport factor 2 family protein [Rickettsiales bacterium]MDG4546053.1 nuclear transport factor 2 family protein [Rickettsiales bacterium]MDG4548299.1 nuclear transport factor 2 family protein [Rickettsiales bacterium]